MDKALAVYDRFDQLQAAAVALYESRYFPDATSKAQAIVKVMAGAELGIPPFASMTGINIQGGKPVIGGNLIATLIKQDPRYDYKIRKLTNDECEIVFFEGGQEVGVSTFTIKDAQAARVWSKKQNGFIPLTEHNQNWKSYPRNMLFNRAISNGAKWFTPGVFGGSPVYTAEEMGLDTDEDGNIVEGSYTPSEPTSAQAPAAGPLPDDEQVIFETPAREFFDVVTAIIDRYQNVYAAQAAAKKLGFTAIPKDAAGRLEMYRAIKAHAAERDAEEVGDSVDTIDGQEALFEDEPKVGSNYQD